MLKEYISNANYSIYKKGNLIHLTCLLLSVMLFLYSFNKNIFLTYSAILLLFFSNIIYCLLKFKDRIILLLFHFAFFAFLMGRSTVSYLQYGILDLPFNDKTIFHILLCLYLSLFALFMGNVLLFHMKYKENEKNEKVKVSFFSIYKLQIRKWSKYVFILGYILNLILIFEQGMYILENSYILYAKSFASSLPSLLRVTANMHTMAFFIYLATIPSKKESKWILILYLVEGVLSLTHGDRGNFVMNIFFLCFYFVFRQRIDNGKEIWIKKKHVIITILLAPFLVAFLSFFVYLREGFSEGQTSLIEQFVRFFKSIGGSVNIIGYGKYFENKIPSDIIYSFGNITQYIQYNPITELLFDNQNFQYYTAEYAMHGTSFMHTISYLIDPTAYLGGHGYGSCYIAEFFNDFGYTGVIAINMFIGSAIQLFNKISMRNTIFTACCFSAIHTLFYVPRGPADYLISYPLNITSLLSISIILILSRYESVLYNLYISIRRRIFRSE